MSHWWAQITAKVGWVSCLADRRAPIARYRAPMASRGLHPNCVPGEQTLPARGPGSSANQLFLSLIHI